MIIGSYSISQCFFMYVWQGVLCENIVEWIIHSLCVLSIHGIISLCVFFSLIKLLDPLSIVFFIFLIENE